jgi:hypothetical protein
MVPVHYQSSETVCLVQRRIVLFDCRNNWDSRDVATRRLWQFRLGEIEKSRRVVVKNFLSNDWG